MKAVAVYNMKGGVGKTTAAVNLSYLAAAAGQRVLLWDLDPQAASSFAFRVRPHVDGFGRNTLETGEDLEAAIKETDYCNLDMLPADFAYRKFDRLLDTVRKPGRIMTALLETVGRDYDVVFLDCPAGFSLLIEGIFGAVDAVLVPAIPTVLSLRMVARAIKSAGRAEAHVELAAFFNMVDRRKTLHRRACEWSAACPELFLASHVPYASAVEQMAVRRMPIAVFAPREPAAAAFADLWSHVRQRLEQPGAGSLSGESTPLHLLRAIETLITRLETDDGRTSASLHQAGGAGGRAPAPALATVHFIHRFDTDRGDLRRAGHTLELYERQGALLVVASRSCDDEGMNATMRAQAQIDSSWAAQILSGAMSPLDALERRLGRPGPNPVDDMRAIVGGRRLRRIDSKIA